MYECSKSNGNIFVKTKNTCYFPLDRVWNIHLETTENSISRFLDFNIFWGSKLPRETPRGSRLWRWQYFLLLRNIRISTNTPSQTPATRLSILRQTFLTDKEERVYYVFTKRSSLESMRVSYESQTEFNIEWQT